MRALLLVPILLLSGIARATPPEGVAPRVRRGLFAEADWGLFSTLGGAKGVSNAESYLQLGVGYDLRPLELRLSFGLGTSAADCFAHSDPATGACALSDDFMLGFVELSAAYRQKVANRLVLMPRLSAGWARLDPSPRRTRTGRLLDSGFDLGAGVGLEWATPLDHFGVGAALMARWVFGPNIPSVAIFPTLKYTF